MPLFRRKKKKELPQEEFTLPEPPPKFSKMPQKGLPELSELPELLEAHEEHKDIKGEFDDLGTEMRKREMQRGEMLDEPKMQGIRGTETLEIPKMPPAHIPMAPKRRFGIRERPIFVKMDQFKESIGHISEIKGKIRNASLLLKSLREIRQKEDHELSEWEDDLQTLKEKLEAIDKKLFSDVE